jgi:succinate dehydrogenase / fumarate reductase flavoprotein subunit
MERYAPTLLDLAPRDMISRAMVTEIRAGRGVLSDPARDDYLLLDATHLGEEVLSKKLPDIRDFCRTYLGLDPAEKPIPVQPTAHYGMGGIPTDLDGRVVVDARGDTYEGLYAAGECACVSVHGANRLGTNSLVDLIVFGRRAGQHMARFVQQASLPPCPSDAADYAEGILDRLNKNNKAGNGHAERIRGAMKDIMMNAVGIYRRGDEIAQAVRQLRTLREVLPRGARATRAARTTQTCWTCSNSEPSGSGAVTAVSAQSRKESGAYAGETSDTG